MSWAAVATIGGSLITGYGADRAARRNMSEQDRLAELEYERSLPWNTSGMFGSATFDEETGVNLGLSNEWQGQYDQAMQDAQAQRDYISGIESDPMAAGKQFYDKQRSLFEPTHRKQNLDMENRLRAQGMLGSTGGMGRAGALLDSQQTQDLNAQYAGMDKAQDLIDKYKTRETQALGLAENIGNMPMQYARLGAGVGGNYDTSGMSQASIAQLGYDNNRWTQLGSTLGNYDYSSMFGGGGMSTGMTQNYMDAGYTADDIAFLTG